MSLSDAREAIAEGRGLPERPSLSRAVAPLPATLENLGLALAWPIVAINLAGTAFGFYYYLPQLSAEPLPAWPLVPDSPTATLFIALSLAAWKLGYADRVEPIHALAFFGCIKLGAWTPYVLLAFRDGFAYHGWPMYNFLFWSHLAMVVEAFLVYRYSDFPSGAVLVAVVWYGANDLVDYFVPVVGSPHHTLVPAQTIDPATDTITHSFPEHLWAASGAVLLTLAATYLAMRTRVEIVRTRGVRSRSPAGAGGRRDDP